MEYIDEAFNQVQKTFHCPICGKPYSKKDIRLKGFLNQTYIFRTYCEKGHTPTVAECVIIMDKSGMKPLDVHDIDDVKQEMEKFDGNFEKLFKSKK